MEYYKGQQQQHGYNTDEDDFFDEKELEDEDELEDEEEFEDEDEEKLVKEEVKNKLEGIDLTMSLFPKTTTSDQHIIPFEFQEEDCNVLVKSNDASIVVPLDFLRSASSCFEKILGQHGGVIQVKSNKPNHIHHSLDLINFKLKNLVQALSFYYPPQTIPLSGMYFGM